MAVAIPETQAPVDPRLKDLKEIKETVFPDPGTQPTTDRRGR